MEENILSIREKQAQAVAKALCANRMNALVFADCKAMLAHIKTLLGPNDTAAAGGSVTLAQTGVLGFLASGACRFLGSSVPGMSADDKRKLYLSSFDADYYFTSSNAITEDGLLFNVDGNGNRVAALTYGPKNVIVVAGFNKIVKDIPAAQHRLETIAAPANTARLHCQTPCTQTGRCMHCKTDGRICCSYVVTAQQRLPGRIQVFLLLDDFGY